MQNHQSLKTNEFFHRLIFLGANLKSLKNIAPEPQSIFSKHEKLFVWENLTKSKTPGLSFSSNGRLSFPPTLSQKKVRTLDLDFVHRKTQSPKRDFRVYMKYLKVNKWFWLTHYHLLSYWNNYYEHTCASNQLLDSLQVQTSLWRFCNFKKKKCWIST